MRLEDKIAKWKLLNEVQETFPYTLEGLFLFAQVVLTDLIPGSPQLNRVQADMLRYLLLGPQYRMIQAYRGATKTALTAIFSVFSIIHAPEFRIAIFSQNGKRAKDISGWVIKLFTRLSFLEFMLPNKREGDRDSIEAFDINYLLKGSDRSASVTCQSIDAGAQGARADLLIADDVESLQNSRSVLMRELLEDNTKEFETINTEGDIVYLGTPQSIESIYNNLPGRGYDARIWPARYPNEKEMEAYGPYLAPMYHADLLKDPSLATGYGPTLEDGKPICPEMFPEELLLKKQLSLGKSKFRLQYMLNTKLSDMERFPLKIKDIIVTSFSLIEGPVLPIWNTARKSILSDLPRPTKKMTDLWFSPIERVYDWAPFTKRVMFIDPSGAGANADEMAYAIIFLLGNIVYLHDIGGVRGGYGDEELMILVNAAKAANCQTIVIEKNFGNGAHMAMMKPLFEEHHNVSLEEVNSIGQKEKRIIDTLEPILNQHRLVVSPEVIRKDAASIEIYPTSTRQTYSLFHQLSNITKDRDSLKHDDRLESLAGAIDQVIEGIDYNMQKDLDARKQQEINQFMKDWGSAGSRRAMMRGEYAGPSKGWKRFK